MSYRNLQTIIERYRNVEQDAENTGDIENTEKYNRYRETENIEGREICDKNRIQIEYK